MNHPTSLREPMTMPNPKFPVKLVNLKFRKYGEILFAHHWHKHLEFLYITSGEAMIEVNSEPLSVKAGDLVVVNSNDLHHGISQSDDLNYSVMITDISMLHSQSIDAVESKYITPITQNRILFRNKITDDIELHNCFTSLIHEFDMKELGYELSIKSYLYRLLTVLLRRYVVKISTLTEYNSRMNNLERFIPIFEHIEQHYNKPLSVQLLCDQIGLSRFHFSRLFKELTGRTVTDYINMIRINKSEILLHTTSKTISEIALTTGFNDIYYFSRAFKKYKNIPPSEARLS